MKLRKINIPVAIISIIAFLFIYFMFLLPLVTINFTGDLNLPDTLQLKNENLIKGTFNSHFNTSEENNKTIIENSGFSDRIEFEYKINTNHNRINGKLINLNKELGKNSIVNVEIIGDGEVIVYKNEWDLKKSDEIVIDEVFDKIRTLKFRISFDNYDLKLAMSDVFVSADGKIPMGE